MPQEHAGLLQGCSVSPLLFQNLLCTSCTCCTLKVEQCLQGRRALVAGGTLVLLLPNDSPPRQLGCCAH